MTEPTSSAGLEPVARPVLALLALFDHELREVSFPDVSAEALHARVDAVRGRAEAIEQAHQALLAAEAELAAEKARLLHFAERAHAYATVFAQEHPDLLDRLSAIELGVAGAAPGRRGRKPRRERRADAESAATSSAELPFEGRTNESAGGESAGGEPVGGESQAASAAA